MEYIVSSAKLGRFGDAATQCQTSQPTVSGQIKQVEQYLGITIFERSRKGVIVTPAGRAVVTLAENILKAYSQLIDIKHNNTHISEGAVRFGVFPTLGPYLLPRILPKIRTQYPKMKLHLIEEKSEPLLKRLCDGDIDIALTALPVKMPDLYVEKIFSEDFWLAAHPEHPLAQHETINLQHLRKQRLLLLDDGHCLRDQALDVCKMVQATEHNEFRATSLETLKHMVATNLGITLVPNIARGGDEIRYIPFQQPPQRHIGMAWRKNTPYKDFYQSLCTDIVSCL